MTLQFTMALLRNPKQMGALVPSSEQLAFAMASPIDPSHETVLELGPGTGAITKALLARGLPMQRLILVEKNAHFAKALAYRFPTAEIISDDASHLSRIISNTGHQQVDTVISSLPLLNMTSYTRIRILKQIFSILSPSGKLIQYTYSISPPVDRKLADLLGICGTRVARVYKNLPPASVWVYTDCLTLYNSMVNEVV